jgi:hypothetical protein
MAGVSQKHDWDKISREYIEAVSEDVRPSLEYLAKKYSVSFGYIQQKCAKDKWVEQSKMFLRKVSEESQSQKITSLASEQTKFDAGIMQVARGLQNQIVLHLNEAVVTKEKLDPKDIGSLTNSLATIQKIGRTSLDMDSWSADKIVNEALKLGYLLTDPRTLTSDTGSDGKGMGKGRDADSTETSTDAIPFDSVMAGVAEIKPTIIPPASRNLEDILAPKTSDRIQDT